MPSTPSLNASFEACSVQVEKNLHLGDLMYADDIAMAGDSAETIRDTLNSIDRYAKVVGLWINASKTKAISLQPHPWIQYAINRGGVPRKRL